MLDTSRVTNLLAEARAFADDLGLRQQLEAKLTYLDRYAAPRRTRCTLGPDFAPHSFTFVLEAENESGVYQTWFTGGLIYHGATDGKDTGALPALAVTLVDTVGWEIHT